MAIDKKEIAILKKLGVDPKRAIQHSLTLQPLGGGWVVKWDGQGYLSEAELTEAIGDEK